jgi:hypothetical protein
MPTSKRHPVRAEESPGRSEATPAGEGSGNGYRDPDSGAHRPELASTAEGHPIAALAGKYADEPLWDEFLEAIEEYRRRIDEQAATAE